MKHFTLDEIIARAIIMLTILIPLIVIAFCSETDSKPTTQSVVPCEFCEGACKLFHKTACETDHNAPDYYYYTYECSQCGNKFTIEIVQE